MAAFCVNIHSKEFKDTAKRLDISEFQLEQIAYKYGNQMETYGKFPSDDYIREYLQGRPETNASESQIELWNLRYSEPRIFDSLDEARQFVQDTSEYFDRDSIVLTTTNEGKFRVSVAKPKTENDFLWRGIPGKPTIDADGNLVLNAGYDNLFKGYGISFATRKGPAYQYGRRGSRNPHVLKIDKDIIDSFYPFDENGGTQSVGRRVIGDEYGEEGSYEERVIMSSANDQIVIPKGKYSIEHETVNTEGMTSADIAEAYIAAFDEANVADEIVFSRIEGHSSFSDADEYFDALVKKTGSKQNAYLVLAAVQYYTPYTTTDRFKELLDSEHKKEFDSLFDEVQTDEWGNFQLVTNKKFDELIKTTTKSKKASWALDENGDLPFQKSSDTGNVTNLPDQMTADEVYQRLSQQYSPDSSEARLSKLVFDALQQTGILFKAADLPEDVRGRFSASDNTIYFNRQGILGNTLLHEAIHAVSIYYMKAINKEGFSKEVQIACKEIEECYDLLKQDMLDRKVPFDSIYGMTSATELVAEITRPEIVSLIKDYDARHRGQNIFQRLINSIAKFFGINKSYGSLEKTLKDALVTLIENPNKELMDRYALENKTIKENWHNLRNNAIEWSKSKKYRGLIEDGAERAPESREIEITISKQDVLNGVAFRVPTDITGGIISESPIGTVFVSTQQNKWGGDESPIFFVINGTFRLDGDNATIPIKLLSREWLTANKFSIRKAKNGMPYISDVRSLFGSMIKTSQQQSPQQRGSINIWAGSNENADLSNMAQRPFIYNGAQYTSVESAFQAAKFRYASPLTQQPIEVQQGFNDPNLSSWDAKRLGSKIVGLDRTKWDADKSGIMKELIKASFQQNPQALQRLLDTGDAVLTHNQESSAWKTEFPRILMEVRNGLRAEQQAQPTQTTEQEPLWAPPAVEREFHTKSLDIVTKIDNLYSGNIDASEIAKEADKAVDWISDQITQYLEDPNIVYNKFFKDNPSNALTEEEVTSKVSKMSRKELLEFIGLDNVINFYKEEVLSMTDENADAFNNMEDEELDKLDAIKENLTGLIQLGFSRFLNREGFGFTLSDTEGETYTTVEAKSKEDEVNPDDVNGNADPDRNYGEEGNQQEHWQIESRTRDIMDNASVAIKQAISDCYVLEDNGKVDSDGNKLYDNAKDNLGRKERVVPIQAVRSIVKWTQGALTLEQMTQKLADKVGANPWISQIVTRLQDQSGNESEFQSQFFTTFCKHFQPYSIVKRRADGTYYTMIVNAHPALNDAMNAISIQYRTGSFPLVSSNGVVIANVEALKAMQDTLESFGDITEDNRHDVVEVIGKVLESIGMPQPNDAINRVLNNTLKNLVWVNAKNIVEKLTAAANDKTYNPFEYGSANGIRGYISNMIKPFTDQLEDTLVSSVFDSGKMYQSYITPSWTTKLFQKMHLPDKEFKQAMLDEFGQSEWFVDKDHMAELAKFEDNNEAKYAYMQDHPEMWRVPWIGSIMQMSEKERQESFQHKVQLNFNKQNYMRGMTDLEYVLSAFTEYFAETSVEGKNVLFGNYRFPMISNKPSNEFIRMERLVGERGRRAILDGFTKIFYQELSRIQTVEMRNLMEEDAGYIANFDVGKIDKETGRGKGKGLQFNFLDYLNDYLYGDKKNTVLGELIDRSLHGNEQSKLSSEEITELETLVQKEVRNHLDTLADNLVRQYRENGVFEALKNVEHIGQTDGAVEEAIREFAWNDNYAQANILELLIVDKAFYKNEEDLQKRLAQVHSPGIRGNWEARDFEGNRVSDGKVRVLKLADYAKVVSETIDNVEAVFNKKIEEADASEKDAWETLKENILQAYREINVVDGQAFVSPTAYRKKAFAFGEWSREDEKVYERLKKGEFNLADIQRVFNPRKPFTYGKVNKRIGAGLNTPIKTLNYGVQYKNSEYLLILADALMKGQETGRPNLLGAIFDVMEESAKEKPTMGIDFVVFESGVKTGLQGAISISDLVENPNGREIAFTRMWTSIFKEDLSYNEDFVDVLNAEDYTTQQSVPEHFMGHGNLQWGSQIRAIMPSDLETTYNGEPVLYDVSYTDEKGNFHEKMTAEEIRKEWEKNTANMIQKGIDGLNKELGLNKDMPIADRNVLISKILQREILSNPRYGVDLLLACSVDENGNFRIPLGDPFQSKRIEQLFNSIIKNRVNKQKVEGGTLVEVTNFGTSKKLEIRYKDKNGELLTSKRDYLAQGHTEEEFKQYLKENQNGIAYYECYAPAWAREVFQKFSDQQGNVDVEAIRMLSPDLLKMFGYRIPTEDKYSTAPYMIVGFLPQEAGDGFMQPWETTVIDGSDFDVDKKNLMRMALEIKSRLMSKKEFYESEGITEETEETKAEFAKYRRKAVSAESILEKIGEAGRYTLSAEDEAMLERDASRMVESEKEEAQKRRNNKDVTAVDTYNRLYAERIEPLENRYNELNSKEDLTSEEEKEMRRLDRQIDRQIEKLNRQLEGTQAQNEVEYNMAVEEAEAKKEEYKNKNRKVLIKDRKTSIVRDILRDGIFRDSSKIPQNKRKLFLAVKRAYLDTLFEVVESEVGTKNYYNNFMFNMQWAIATHASTADKMLNPGNFDPQKRVGYMVAANRLGYAWEELEKMETGDIKDLVFTSKNLMDFDVQTQFYKQNAVAGQILGIFAVAKSAHAIFEGRRYGIVVDTPFSIDGMSFSGIMEYDKKYDRSGVTLIGKHLGSLVGASADAVKDPVLNFMNINKETVNVLNTALRLGVDFDTIALLLSSKAVADVLNIYRRESLSKKTSFNNEVKRAIRELEKLNYIGKDSPLKAQDLTKKELVWAITGKIRENDEHAVRRANEIKYKILNAVVQLNALSQRAQPLTDLSRLNSVTSAPGPLHINTIASDRKVGPSVSMEGIVKMRNAYWDNDGHVVVVGNAERQGSLVNGVELTESNLAEMLQSGMVEMADSYDDATRDMVFEEIPSLKTFYEPYNIVKRLFKDLGFTTASEQFSKVLAAIPKDMEFSIYNKEKLLSSLADFFQSYVLVQSGVIKSSELKRYTQDFVEEFIKGDYKSQYKDNPFIQAITPTLISKRGEPDRYALKIETTGMEQSEKDALSAGWIQLEKQNPELSHKLFVYNFFRGGIGFNPKTFMGLVPIQVKERIQGYIDAYTHIPEVTGKDVFDQWVRNNWGNTDLVTRVTGMRADENTKTLVFEGKNLSKVYRSPYIRVVTESGDFLFKEQSVGEKSKVYTKISPLGNNGEYLEMFATNDKQAVFDNPQRATLTPEESDHLEERVEDPTMEEQTTEEQARDLVDFYQTTYGEERGTETEKSSIEDAFESTNKDLDITTNKDKFDEILEDFC